MADPVVDNADYAVDELKRKARRRLVGAVILALAAATILPMLLEQDQKPLGDDVSVQIPPVDGDKFVSRLKAGDAAGAAGDATVRSGAISSTPGKGTPAPAPSAAPAAPPPPASPAPSPNPAPATAGSLPTASPAADAKPAAAQSKPAGGAPGAAADAKPAKAGESKAATPATPVNPALTSSATLPTAAPSASAGADAAPAAPTGEGFVVQLGAFTDKYGANALARKLKAAGYPAYTEPVETSRGTLWRVRVGGYPTRAAAVEARGKLKADGQDGVVTAAK